MGMPPSIAETGIGLASKGRPWTPLRGVGGKGTVIAAATAAAVGGGTGASDDDDDVGGGAPPGGRLSADEGGVSVFISLGPGVEVLDEEPLLLVQSVEPSLLFCIFSLLVVVFPLVSMAEATPSAEALSVVAFLSSVSSLSSSITPSLSLASFSIFSISEVSLIFPTSSSSSGCAELT